MPETIKCVCSNCGAKYRLPLEAQGRTARCKRCGEKFSVPRQQSLEDNVLTWLTAPDEERTEEDLPSKPRVISMPAREGEKEESGKPATAQRARGPIRVKGTAPKSETA